MPRVQALVVRDDRVMMVKHRQNGEEWWCLPGGGLESGETPQEGVLRELKEECQVEGKVLRQTSHVCYGQGDESISFLVNIGDQMPSLGHDPEVNPGEEVLTEVRWMKLREIPERDRVFLWAAGLLGVGGFFAEAEKWRDELSYPAR